MGVAPRENPNPNSGNGSGDARFWRAGKLHQGGHGMRAWLPLCRRGKVGSAVLQSRGEEAMRTKCAHSMLRMPTKLAAPERRKSIRHWTQHVTKHVCCGCCAVVRLILVLGCIFADVRKERAASGKYVLLRVEASKKIANHQNEKTRNVKSLARVTPLIPTK